MLYSRRDAWKGQRVVLGSATLRAAGLRALGGALFVALAVGAVGYAQASASEDACKDSGYSKKLRKECKEQAEAQQNDAIWSALAAGGAVGLFRFCGEGLYDRRRQHRGLGPKLGDVQW
jgi:hypothetical protein